MYTVFGYDSMCYHFKYVLDSFVEAVKLFRELSVHSTTFIMRETPTTCSHVSW